VKKKAFTREERQMMVVQWFAIRIQKGNTGFATLAEIARGLDITPSSHLQKIVDGLCFQNKLMWRNHNRPGRWQGKEYMLYPGTYRAPRRDPVQVKVRGKAAGQLELL
jgi:hypothetical protein